MFGYLLLDMAQKRRISPAVACSLAVCLAGCGDASNGGAPTAPAPAPPAAAPVTPTAASAPSGGASPFIGSMAVDPADGTAGDRDGGGPLPAEARPHASGALRRRADDP